MFAEYDVIVVGAGHAGCEAAAAAANMGSKVLLVTMNMQTIGQMSCNPAMGGVAKGQIVREIDALGGYSGIVTDRTTLQFRMLNSSKGSAMWSPRAQTDRHRFAEQWRIMLENTPNVDFWQDMVRNLIVKEDSVCGVVTGLGTEIYGKTVVLTNGTFLNGVIHIGEKHMGGGRTGEKAATGLTEQLQSLGFESGRMKTGTPPRVDGRSLNYEAMDIQHGDDNRVGFSYKNIEQPKDQRPCYITYTSTALHETLKEGFDRSPMFNGRIQGLGPRYCPSIEDKINRFADKDRHQIFVEPEGFDTVEVYVNGFSTSLPEDVQHKALKMLPGFENVRMFRPGYAIEYDYFPPTQLQLSLETKLVKNLFFAGQINGTTGYEEAACQGLVAGINAHRTVKEQDCIIFDRANSYIGVLIDDLVTKGTEEPYRMFTSRAEHRLHLRQDNADLRLTRLGHSLGLADDERLKRVEEKEANILAFDKFLKEASVEPKEINDFLIANETAPISEKQKLATMLSRPQIELSNLISLLPRVGEFLVGIPMEDAEQSVIKLKYGRYLEKEQENIARFHKLENRAMRGDFNYRAIESLSIEAREKLSKIQPTTLGQASRISGVSAADISILMVMMER